MNDLFHLQNQFQQFLLEANDNFKVLVISTEKVSAEARLAIYSHAYQARLIDALNSNFPALYDFVGTELFEEIASEYIAQFPSLYRSIRWFGNQFSSFLSIHPEYKTYPYLAELAKFEWAQTLTFDAADDTVLQLDEIKKIPPITWQDLTFRIHPSVQRVDLSWNVVQIWQALMDDLPVPEPIASPSPLTWLLWRNDFTNLFNSLSNDEASALDTIIAGKTFGQMCEILCEWFNEDEVAVKAATLLRSWIQSGLFTQIIFSIPKE